MTVSEWGSEKRVEGQVRALLRLAGAVLVKAHDEW